MKNSRGSTWSKWDLHIHTPESICNNYGGADSKIWDKFIDYLENLPDEVKVIGINDYYFIDGFEKVMKYKKDKDRLKNIEKIFPILEFRIDTFASASESKLQKINLHILFNINDNDWENEVKKIREEFIECIHLSKHHPTKMLKKESFIEDAGDLKAGFDNIFPNTEEVFKILSSDTWKDRVFTFLGYKEWNNLEKGKQLRFYKENLFNKVDAFFTASDSCDNTNKKEIINYFGNKVILHSQDIHDFSKLEKENYKCFTWIKADKTFEGLRQILIEPEERIRLQEKNPDLIESKTNVIDFIEFSNSQNWFEEKKIELNRGLVSIIGEKGSGKTALLDLISVACDEGIYEKDINKPNSFYFRAKNKIKGTNIRVGFVGNNEIKKVIDGNYNKTITDKYAKVRYISLKELENYCDEGNEFQKFIKDIIFEANPEVKEYDESSINIKKKIEVLINDLSDLLENVKIESELLSGIESKKLELDNHIKIKPEIVIDNNDKDEITYQNINDKINECKLRLEEVEGEIRDLEKLIIWINDYKISLENKFLNDYKMQLNNMKFIKKEKLGDLHIKIDINGLNNLDNRIDILNQEKDRLNIDNEKLDNNKKIFEEKLNKYKEEKQILENWYSKKLDLEKDIKDLQKELEVVENKKWEIENIKEKIIRAYIELVKVKYEQKQKYQEMKKILEEDDIIKFGVKIEFDELKFLDKENSIIKHNQGNSQEQIISKLKHDLILRIVEIIEKDNLNTDIGKLSNIIRWLLSESFINEVFGERRNFDNLLKREYNLKDYFEWLLDDYFKVNYYVEYKQKPLEALSPGQKGLALIKIMLKLDKNDKPLLIDQPEDNLDNKSVFKDLVEDIRKIKKKRQVIIATHNPNLVVNTDSEQVIVAKFEDNKSGEPKIKYFCGSLENEKIKNSVCEILEGGTEAFKNREKRYLIKDI